MEEITLRNAFALPLFFAASLAAADVHFGPTPIAANETARMIAYCDGSVAPNPCMITFEFRSPRGGLLFSDTRTIPAGTAQFVDLPAARAGIGRGLGEIDPCWDIQFGAALLSVEIFDTGSQRTRLSINWGDRSMPRSGDIDFAPAGLSRGDTARLGAFCPADDVRLAQSCRVHFEFHDLAGRLLKQSDLTLQPGTSGFLDLSFSEAASDSRRLMIDPCFKVGDGGPIVGTLALLDNGLGQPLAQIYPATLATAQ
jgi:hypothetical protein